MFTVKGIHYSWCVYKKKTSQSDYKQMLHIHQQYCKCKTLCYCNNTTDKAVGVYWGNNINFLIKCWHYNSSDNLKMKEQILFFQKPIGK